MNQLDPTHIMQTATGFWASKVLLTAVEFDLFSTVGDRSMTAEQLGEALGLHPRGRYDFFDALVALGFLHRDGDGPEGRYRNTPETAACLVKQSPTYIGGMPEMFNSRLFGFWNSLGEALRTGKPQNEILHDWNLEQKLQLIRKAYDALPEGGALIAIENVIDDARRENAFGLLMSLNMLIEFGDASDYTGADFRAWCGQVGFRRFDLIPLAGPSVAAVAYK
jgi:Dimerisation domain/O-methyltransferase domain